MSTHNILVFLSSVLYVISGSTYVMSVLRVRTKPNIVPFIVWSFANVSLLISLVVARSWTSVPLIAIAAATSIAVCLLSLQSGQFYISRWDVIVFILGMTGIVVWLLTKHAAWNVYIVQLVDVLNWSAIIAKSYKSPHLEARFPWQLNFLASVLLVLAIPSRQVVQWIVPVVQISFSGLLNLVLLKDSFMKTADSK